MTTYTLEDTSRQRWWGTQLFFNSRQKRKHPVGEGDGWGAKPEVGQGPRDESGRLGKKGGGERRRCFWEKGELKQSFQVEEGGRGKK